MSMLAQILPQNVTVEKAQCGLARMADLQTGDEESKIRLLDRETREFMEGIERILSAREEGAPYEMCVATSGRSPGWRLRLGRSSTE